MLSCVLGKNFLNATEAEEMRVRAEIARTVLFNSGESSPIEEYDVESGHVEFEDELALYDALVPIFFR